MKKRLFALLMAAVLMLSLAFTLAACGPDDGAPVDEKLPATEGTPSIDVVTDPSDPGATENDGDNYIHNN